jgi:hypothetical protein
MAVRGSSRKITSRSQHPSMTLQGNGAHRHSTLPKYGKYWIFLRNSVSEQNFYITLIPLDSYRLKNKNEIIHFITYTDAFDMNLLFIKSVSIVNICIRRCEMTTNLRFEIYTVNMSIVVFWVVTMLLKFRRNLLHPSSELKWVWVGMWGVVKFLFMKSELVKIWEEAVVIYTPSHGAPEENS